MRGPGKKDAEHLPPCPGVSVHGVDDDSRYSLGMTTFLCSYQITDSH